MGQSYSQAQPVQYSQGTSVYKIPNNSGSIDIDVTNLQRCINAGGGSSCISNYVQGYNTANNTFVPTHVAGGFDFFDVIEGNNTFNNKSLITLVVLILITLFIGLRN